MKNSDSPYLRDPNRLADVIAAIQAMATYKRYKLTFDGWSERISGDVSKKDHWMSVFEQHPEFFRLDGDKAKASLVWRRQYPRRYDVEKMSKISDAEYQALPAEYRQTKISRDPLTSPDIKTLLDTAINLHSRAVSHQQEQRWWLTLICAGIAFVGAIMAALLKR